jgi:hypothetical protein
MFNFQSSSSHCLASDFKADRNCGRTLKKDCILSTKSQFSLFNEKHSQVLKELTFINQHGIRTTVVNPSCRILKLQAVTAQERQNCGYFCFFHELDKIFEDEKSFSCRYIPPQSSTLNAQLPSSLGSESIWENSVKTVSVESFCALDKKKMHKTREIEIQKSEKEYFEELEINKLRQQLEDEVKKESLLEDKLKQQKFLQKERDAQLERKLFEEIVQELKKK